VQALREEEHMGSTLYQEILAEGMARGEAKAKKETVIGILNNYLGGLEPAVRERIQALDSLETLTHWYEEALRVLNASAAQQLLEKITKD
jgi:hypothetical protein